MKNHLVIHMATACLLWMAAAPTAASAQDMPPPSNPPERLPAATPPPPPSFGADELPSGHELGFSVGLVALGTSGGGAWKYNDGYDDYIFSMNVPAQSSAFGGALTYAYSNAWSLGAVAIEPTADLLAGFGNSASTVKFSFGGRARYSVGNFRPWVGVGLSIGALFTSIASVPYGNNTNADFMIAPDGSHIQQGTSVSASTSAIGGYATLGADYALGRRWGGRVSASYAFFSSMCFRLPQTATIR